LGPLGTAATNRPIVPAPGEYDDGETGGMMIGKGNRSTRRKPAPLPLCPPQTPHACPDANPGRRGGKPATNRLSYGTSINITPTMERNLSILRVSGFSQRTEYCVICKSWKYNVRSENTDFRTTVLYDKILNPAENVIEIHTAKLQ
jgi:hypothetical protein